MQPRASARGHPSPQPAIPSPDLRDAASVLEFHNHKGLPYVPAEDGFVYSITEIEAFAQRTKRLNKAWKVDNFLLLGFRTPRNPRILKSVEAIC